jgi:hypothetical protein
MNTKFLSLWLDSVKIVAPDTLTARINISRIRPLERSGVRMNTFAMRYFMGLRSHVVVDFDGNVIGRCLVPPRHLQDDPTERSNFEASILVSDWEWLDSVRHNLKCLRCGCWAPVEINAHAKTGAEQATVIRPGIEFLVLGRVEVARQEKIAA